MSATAWVSHAVNRYENATCPESGAPLTCTNNAASPVWGDKLTNTDTSFGLGLRSQVTAQLKVGADFTQSDVRDEMNTFAISPAGPLPDMTLEENMTVVVQPNVITRDHTAGVQVGELIRVTRTGFERLHRARRGFFRAG